MIASLRQETELLSNAEAPEYFAKQIVRRKLTGYGGQRKLRKAQLLRKKLILSGQGTRLQEVTARRLQC